MHKQMFCIFIHRKNSEDLEFLSAYLRNKRECENRILLKITDIELEDNQRFLQVIT